MPPPPSSRSLSPLLEALGLDLESSLAAEPRFLTDARLLGSLHAELRQEIGAPEAARALLQLGFVHGLRDAARIAASGLAPGLGAGPAQEPGSPLLALQISPPAAGSAGVALGVRGSWPERHEAEAVRAALGPAAEPQCFASAGYTAGWLSGILGGDLLVIETSCAARGDDACRFEARECSAWRETADARSEAFLDALPFEALRRLVERDAPPAAPAPDPGSFEAGSPVIHVWGPVMVIPFAGVDESLRALDLIGSDPGARDVRVVVVDLSGAIIDDGFGAVAVEQILAAIEGWGAEPILAGVSPLSAAVVSDLERGSFLTMKDLPAAIARAFQIAEAQRLSV